MTSLSLDGTRHMANGNTPPSVESTIARMAIPFVMFGGIVVAPFDNGFVSRAFLLVVVALCLLLTLARLIRPVPLTYLRLGIFSVLYLAGYSLILFHSCHVGGSWSEAGRAIARAMLPVSVLMYCAAQDWRDTAMYRRTCLLGIVLLIPFTLLHAAQGMQVGSVYRELHSNTLGAFGLLAVVFGLVATRALDKANRLLPKMLIATGLLTILITRSRASMLAVAVFLVAYALVTTLRRAPAVATVLLVSTVALVLALPLVFQPIMDSDAVQKADEISQRLTDKVIASGRGKHWEQFLWDISRQPWLGYGVASHESWTRALANGKVIKLSPHNYYLAVLHEVGVVGLASIMALLFVVWRTCARAIQDPVVRTILAFMFAVFVHQCFEVSLTTGTYVLAAGFWALFGCGVASAMRRQSPQSHRTRAGRADVARRPDTRTPPLVKRKRREFTTARTRCNA